MLYNFRPVRHLASGASRRPADPSRESNCSPHILNYSLWEIKDRQTHRATRPNQPFTSVFWANFSLHGTFSDYPSEPKFAGNNAGKRLIGTGIMCLEFLWADPGISKVQVPPNVWLSYVTRLARTSSWGIINQIVTSLSGLWLDSAWLRPIVPSPSARALSASTRPYPAIVPRDQSLSDK